MTEEKSLLENISRQDEVSKKATVQDELHSAHEHAHTHPNKKKVVNRLARIEGHVRSIKEMVDADRDCSEVLIQIAAVRKALDNTAKVILKEHLEHCILHAIEKGDGSKSLEDFETAIDRYLR
jgi:CsoR family transcriptional regulator, copper-sensing transcriptional repressor